MSKIGDVTFARPFFKYFLKMGIMDGWQQKRTPKKEEEVIHLVSGGGGVRGGSCKLCKCQT